MLRIIVCGYMIRMPVAGNVLAFAQYMLGFERLGHSVLYLEESGWPQPCYDPANYRYSDEPHSGMQYVRELLKAAGANCELAYVDSLKGRFYGIDSTSIARHIHDADLILNVGGVCWLPEFASAKRLALVDMDPMFTQVGKFGHAHLEHYHTHFTYGTNIGNPDSRVPTLGIDWQPTLPPVVPDIWRSAINVEPSEAERFTSIANWSAYGEVEWDGERYGQKDRELLKFVDLPRQTESSLEVAVSGMPSDVAAQFRAAGWSLADAARVSRSLDDYRSYICASKGEFSVAKHGYVHSRSGWISDRTVCYLAAGRPAVVEETGVPDDLIHGEAFSTFTDMHSASKALQKVQENYWAARTDAIRLANEVFSYQVVLPKLLEHALRGSPLISSSDCEKA
jgi:hypothetical protein